MLRVNQLNGFGSGGGEGPEPIAFVGGAITSKIGSTSGTSSISLTSGLTGGISSSVLDGDLVIAAYAAVSDVAGGVDLTITNGATNYTLIGSELFAGGSEDCNLRVAYRFVSGDTQTVFGPTGTVGYAGVTSVYVFRNVNLSTPLDVAATTITSGSANPDPPSITPVTPGAYVVCVGGQGHVAGTVTFGSTGLTDFLTAGQTDSGKDCTLGIGHVPDWVSGAVNIAAFTGGAGTAGGSATMSLALRPE